MSGRRGCLRREGQRADLAAVVLRMRQAGVSWKEIGGELGISRWQAWRYMKHNTGYMQHLSGCNQPPMPETEPRNGHGRSRGRCTSISRICRTAASEFPSGSYAALKPWDSSRAG